MDIIRLLSERGIPFTTTGHNVKEGHVNIKCPFCGDADPSMHLGIEPITGKWGCWRNSRHRGRNLAVLFMKLIGCSYQSARSLLADGKTLDEVVVEMKRPRELVDARKVRKGDDWKNVTIDGLRPLVSAPQTLQLEKRFWDYLKTRGYDASTAYNVAKIYRLEYALSGPFKNRIVFPIVYNKKRVGYTGRAIDGGKLRYLSEPGRIVKRCIMNYDQLFLRGGRNLYITEGPMDWMRIDYGCRKINSPDRATCTFGVSYTQEQLSLLFSLKARFNNLIVLFDNNAMSQATGLANNLLAKVQFLPEGIDDPGDLYWNEVEAIVKQNL